jgi:hypothetical protein
MIFNTYPRIVVLPKYLYQRGANASCIMFYRPLRTTIMATTAVITYIRVSTSQQGRSGLGIEAQRQSLQHFAKAEGLELLREFIEVETGKGSDALDRRPQLKAALAAAKKLKCPRCCRQAGPSQP